jgi:hypothetical protein
MSSEARADVDLKARCTSAQSSLQLEYLAENISDRPLFLFNILHGHIREDGIYPLLNAAYVELEPETIVVSQKLFPVPQFMLVEHRNIPFVTRLLPRARVHAIIELSLPLRPFDPYRSFDASELLQWVEKPLLFELGYFVGADGTEKLGRSYPTDQGPRPGFEAFPEGSQKLARTAPLGEFPIKAPREEPAR